jgi:CRP/FNR family transcriptional regulator, anaerobic regulatory protein
MRRGRLRPTALARAALVRHGAIFSDRGSDAGRVGSFFMRPADIDSEKSQPPFGNPARRTGRPAYMRLHPGPIASTGATGEAGTRGRTTMAGRMQESIVNTLSVLNVPRQLPPRVWHAMRNVVAPINEKGPLRDLVRLLGGDPSTVRADCEDTPFTLWRVRQDAALLHEGSPPRTFYVVRSGSLKCVKTLEDGYEQVLSFAQPGELLGFEALHCGHQPVTVVALEDATVFALPVHELARLRHECPALDAALQHALSRQLVRAAETAEMMSAVASDVRLARFLLWMSARMAEIGQSQRRLLLRMGRRDIGSLLGLAQETVSRSFTTLADAGYVKVDNREVEIVELDRLRARARGTRGLADDECHAHRHTASRHPAPKAWRCNPGALVAA